MSSIFSINGAGSMFFADSSNSIQNSSSSIFGNTSSLLGDYAMIKSGGYKKLLTAYYASQKQTVRHRAAAHHRLLIQSRLYLR